MAIKKAAAFASPMVPIGLLFTKEKLKSFFINRGFKQEDDRTITITLNKIEYRIVFNALTMRIDRKFLTYQWKSIKEYKWLRLRSGYYSEINIIDEKVYGVKR